MSQAHSNRICRRVFGVQVGTLAAGLAVGSGVIAGESGKRPDLVAVTGGKTLSKAEASYKRMRMATERLGGLASIVKGKHVQIKVNAIDQKTGMGSTSIDAIEALIRLCKESGPLSVSVISHDWGFDSKHLCGRTIRGAVAKAGAQLIQMKGGPAVYKPVKVNDGGWGSIYVAKPIFNPNTVLINLPRLKTHPFTCYTGCIKNQMGLTYYMSAFHCSDDRGRKPSWTSLPRKMATAYKHIFKDMWALHIVDAQDPSFGWDGPPPERVRSFPACTTIVSTDAVAADVYAAGILHKLEPKLFVEPLSDWTKGDGPYAKKNYTKGNYLLECGKLGVGETDLGKLKIEELTI